MYDHIVSLGWYCGIASSMAKNGFRENSGPFDWMFSSLDGVLHFLESSFEDFLDWNHLEILSPLCFCDDRGITFNHDCKKDLSLEYEEINKRYKRRIRAFKTFNNICFIRAVKNQAEIEYINENYEYIKKVMRNNDIIFLIPYYLRYDNFKFCYFLLNINAYQGNYRSSLRGLFEKSTGLIEHLQANYPEEKRKKNLEFDMLNELREGKNIKAEDIEKRAIAEIDELHKNILISEERCQNLAKMIQIDFSQIAFPEEIEIYGMGTVGEAFYHLAKEYTNIKCFIDQKGGNAEIPVYKTNEYINENRKIIVTPTFYFDKIKSDLSKRGVIEDNIISLKSIIN